MCFRLPTVPKLWSPTLSFYCRFWFFYNLFFSQKNVFSYKSIFVATYVKTDSTGDTVISYLLYNCRYVSFVFIKCTVQANIFFFQKKIILPTYLPTYLSTYLPSYLPIYLPTFLPIYLPIYLPTYLSTYLPTYLPTYHNFKKHITGNTPIFSLA